MTDVVPPHITDKGNWNYTDGMIVLEPDNKNEKPLHNLRFLPLLYAEKGKSYKLLVGLDGDQEEFLNEAQHINPWIITSKSSYKKTEDLSEKTYMETVKYLWDCCSKWRSIP